MNKIQQRREELEKVSAIMANQNQFSASWKLLGFNEAIELVKNEIDKIKNDIYQIGKYNSHHQKEYKEFLSISQMAKRLDELKQLLEGKE